MGAPRKCRKKIREYMGRGGPPLFAPLQLADFCNRRHGHTGKCITDIDPLSPEIQYEKRVSEETRTI